MRLTASSSLRSLLRLAGPLVIAELSMMLGGVATTLMLGRLSPTALGIQGLGSILFFNIAVFGFDLLLGLDYPVSHAIGARRLDEAAAYLVQGCWLAVALSVLLMTVMWHGIPLLAHWDLDPTVIGPTIIYIRTLSLGLLPVFLWLTCRRYLQARGYVRPVMLTQIVALAVELLTKASLIFGYGGAPRLELQGAAWGAVVEFTFLGSAGLALIWIVTRHDPTHTSFAPDARRLRELMRLGLPSGLRSAIEVGVIAAVTTLAARVDATSLAAHQIALNLASLTFMVPLGVSHAVTVQVGNALGAGQAARARHAGWTAIAAGAVVMAMSAVTFSTIPGLLVRAYTTDATVLALGVPLLLCAAAFQIFDGTQVIATGVLRGCGDTRTPMIANLAAHWLIGLPLGWILCFQRGWGVLGLWVGLATGLMVVGIVLLGMWAQRARRLVSA